ncbi:MAG: zf-HC2 domain-containing protein [Oscillospiraceae bacterium]|nr:zf-HC2 domain-containing protein [Oscillospiraceae bacterium]
MTDCDKYMELISSMLDGELSGAQEAELRTHIEKCENCKRAYNAFASISGALKEELVTPPDTLSKGVMYKIKNQNKAGKRFAFGRFTAIAACLAIILFGASHFGLLGGTKLGTSGKGAAAPKAVENQTITADMVPESSESPAEERVAGSSEGSAADAQQGDGQTMMTESVPEAQCEALNGAVLQFGFTSSNMLTSNDNAEAKSKEPDFLFDAKEILVYEGKYYFEKQDGAKNKLLFTLSTEEDLKTLYDLVTAFPDNSVEYSPEDVSKLKDDPLYTLYVPANTEKDKDAEDKVICVWFVDEEMWCVIADAKSPNPAQNVSAEKILYKAEGVRDKFDTAIKKIKTENGIM